MKLVHGLQDWQACARRGGQDAHNGSVITIGNFDGVHIGHTHMLQRATTLARQHACCAIALSFEPLPQEYFRGEAAPRRLHGLRNRVRAIEALGLDYLVLLPFDADFAALSAESFIQNVLVDTLDARHLIIGDDFQFGRARLGTIDTLRSLADTHGFYVHGTETISEAGERVSSTRIRQALSDNELALATQLLGRPYRIDGRVVHGEKLGRQLGFPTANVALKKLHPPLKGVFAVKVHDHHTGLSHPGVANLGERPTIGGRKLLLEVHLLDAAAELYGHHLAVDFLHHIRGEQRFESLEALKSQISRDCDTARDLLS